MIRATWAMFSGVLTQAKSSTSSSFSSLNSSMLAFCETSTEFSITCGKEGEQWDRRKKLLAGFHHVQGHNWTILSQIFKINLLSWLIYGEQNLFLPAKSVFIYVSNEIIPLPFCSMAVYDRTNKKWQTTEWVRYHDFKIMKKLSIIHHTSACNK